MNPDGGVFSAPAAPVRRKQKEVVVVEVPAAQAPQPHNDILPFFLCHYKDITANIWTRLAVILGSQDAAMYPASAIRMSSAYHAASPEKRIEFGTLLKSYVDNYHQTTGRNPCQSDEHLRCMSLIWMQLLDPHRSMLKEMARLMDATFNSFFDAAKGHGGFLFDITNYLVRLTPKEPTVVVSWITLALHWKLISKEMREGPMMRGALTKKIKALDLGEGELTFLTFFNLWCLQEKTVMEDFMEAAMRAVVTALDAIEEEKKKVPRKRLKN